MISLPPEKDKQTFAPSILGTIGNTPAIHLPKLEQELGCEIIVKLEFFNPTGSLKDRIYHQMIDTAEEKKILRSNMHILECSTGNAGISCAFVAAAKGYPCTIVMPEGMSNERKKTIRAYGASLIFTPGGESDVDRALTKAEEIAASAPKKYWMPRQFSNPENPKTHYQQTGPEFWRQLDGSIDVWVATQGTGGTLTGVGQYFREQNPTVRIFAAEPSECPTLSRHGWGPHDIEGIGDGFVPQNLDLTLLDGIVTVSSDEAIEMTTFLAEKEGVFCGISSGANLMAVKKLIRWDSSIKRIATIINDNGQRYFSTRLFDSTLRKEKEQRAFEMDAYSKQELEKYQKRWTIID